MKPTHEEVFNDFLERYPALKDKVQRYEPCERLIHISIYIWIDDRKYYYSLGAKVLQPMYI